MNDMMIERADGAEFSAAATRLFRPENARSIDDSIVSSEDTGCQQDELIRTAARITRTGGWTLDLKSSGISCSDAVVDIMKIPPGEELSLTDPLNFFPEPGRTRIADALALCARNGLPFDMQVDILTRDSARVPVRVCGEAERGPDGEIERLQGAFQDLTELSRIQADVPLLAMRLSATLENMAGAFYLLDQEWRFEYLNAEATRLIAMEQGMLLGRVIWEVYPEYLESPAYEGMLRAAADGLPAHFEVFSHGSRDWFAFDAYPTGTSMAVYLRKITSEKLVELALERSNQASQMLSRCTEVVIRTETEKDLLGTICRIATETCDFRSAWAGYALNDDRKTIAPQAWAGVEAGCLSEGMVWAADDPKGQGVAGRAVRDGHWIHVAEISEDEQSGPEGEEHAFHGAIAVPLKEGMITFGVFVLYLPEARAVEAGEIQYLQKAVDVIAQGIINLRLRAKENLAMDQLVQKTKLLEKAKDVILCSKLDHTILYWNQSAERIYGWSVQEATGRTTLELLSPDARMMATATLATVERGEWHGELSQIRRDGEPVVVESRWTLMRDDDGRPHSILSICTDITRRKIDEEKIPQVQRIGSAGTLALGLAHDLNNVFTPIMMALDLLKTYVHDDDGLEVLNMIDKSARRGADMVQQVLTSAREMDGVTQNADLEALPQDVVTIVEETVPQQVLAGRGDGKDR